jgi:hypothetical protein
MMMSHPVDSIRYTRNNMLDKTRKLTGSSIEKTFYYSMPKFAQQNGKIGVQGYGHPMKRMAKTRIDPNARPAKLPYDAQSAYGRQMDEWREGMMGEGSLSYRLQIRARPEVQAQLRRIEQDIPFDTPNRNQLIEEITGNLLRTIEREEIKTGATEGIKARFGIAASDARREMEQFGLMEKRRQQLGRGTRSKFGEDSYEPSDQEISDGELDWGEDVDDQYERSRPQAAEPDDDVAEEQTPTSNFAMRYTEFMKAEADLDIGTANRLASKPSEELRGELAEVQQRLYGFLATGLNRGYNPMVRLAQRVKALRGNSGDLPTTLNTDEDIQRFSRLTGITPQNVHYLKEQLENRPAEQFGELGKKYNINSVARSASSRGKVSREIQYRNALEAVMINTVIANIISGRPPSFAEDGTEGREEEEEYEEEEEGGEDDEEIRNFARAVRRGSAEVRTRGLVSPVDTAPRPRRR